MSKPEAGGMTEPSNPLKPSTSLEIFGTELETEIIVQTGLISITIYWACGDFYLPRCQMAGSDSDLQRSQRLGFRYTSHVRTVITTILRKNFVQKTSRSKLHRKIPLLMRVDSNLGMWKQKTEFGSSASFLRAGDV